jgi:transposase
MEAGAPRRGPSRRARHPALARRVERKRRDHVIYYTRKADRAQRTLRGIDEQVAKAAIAVWPSSSPRSRLAAAAGRWPLPECWVPPGHILECRALLELYHDLRAEHTAWVQRIHAVFFHQGAPQLGAGALRTGRGAAAVRAAAAACLSPAEQLQVATALDMLACLEGQLGELRRRLVDTARHLTGARVLSARLYGVGPVTALAMTAWLGGAGRFSSSRKAVRFAGLDITVCSFDGKRSPGHLSRQGPAVLRWAV